ncbi:T9SS type A sorting domain-containing protein [Microscilla marina]|uniref:PKD domain-containing protein n=1 Tax=Microscilla marina ATCC 23134 TaxID=313606 RepID=A1ZXK9_MICM2|nr:T9SS type A sorting domain-containing protein [Microscilla marina]EAY24884.1 hypothetical protein M23134_05859 [Microscilla marina ATCC 23134]
MLNQYKTKHLAEGVAKTLKRGAVAKITLTVVATTLLLLVANAWYAPNLWNFSQGKATTNAQVQLKVQAKNDFYESTPSAGYPVTIVPVGIKITQDTVKFCEGTTETQPLTELVLQETGKGDFSGKDTLVLALSDQDFTLGNDNLKIMAKFQDPQDGKFQNLKTPLQEKFQVNITNENQLQLVYDFTGDAFKSRVDQLKISGLTVTPKTEATASVVTLRPTPDSFKAIKDWKGVFRNTDFGWFTMVGKPTNVTDIEVVKLSNQQLRLVAVGASHATHYQWTLPAGVALAGEALTDKVTVEFTNTSIITIQHDPAANLSDLTVTVKSKNATCESNDFNTDLSNDLNIEVNFQTIDTLLCVGGTPIAVPQHIVCTEAEKNAFSTQGVTVELTTGFKLLAKPRVFFGKKGEKLKEITDVAYTTDQRGIGFSLEDLEKDDELNQLEIRGVVVQATKATSANRQALLRASGLSSRTLSLASFIRYDPPPTPEFLEVPSLLCKNTSVTFSVKPQSGFKYSWGLPVGVTIKPSSLPTASRIMVNIGNSFNGGMLKVTATSTHGCKSATVSKLLAAPPAKPLDVITIEGKDNLFVGEEATYTAKDGQPAATYQWTVPVGLEPVGDFETISNNTISTTEPTLKLKATSTVDKVDLKVQGVNACDDKGEAATKSITSVQSAVEFVPVIIENICPEAQNFAIGDIIIKEQFVKDFKGAGSLVLTSEDVSLVDSKTDTDPLTVTIDAAGLGNDKFSASVTDNKLTISYNFDDSFDHSGINTMVIKGLKINLKNNTPTQLSFTTDLTSSTLNIGDSYVFAQIGSWVTFDTNEAEVKIYKESSVSSTPINTLCATTNTYTLKATGIEGATSYEWTLPSGLVFKNDGDNNNNTVEVRLNNTVTLADGDLEISVVGKKEGIQCESNMVTHTIKVLTKFAKDVKPKFTNTIKHICQKEGEIKSLSVEKIEGATHYQWTLHDALEAVTPDEGVNKADNVILTSGTTLWFKVKSTASFGTEKEGVKIGVKGVKMTDENTCSITTDEENSGNFTLYGAPEKVNIEGIEEGKVFAKNGNDILLEGTPVGGYFKLTKGIITKEENGELKTYFSPEKAGIDEHTLTYVYTNGECEWNASRTVKVVKATSTGLATQCRTTTEAKFSLPTKTNDGWLLYAVIEELGTDGKSVITKNDAQNTDAPTPMLITDSKAKALNCESPAIKDNIDNIKKLNADSNYHYKLDPSRVTGTSITVKAVYVKLIGDACVGVNTFDKESVEILPLPTKPTIAPSFSAKICTNKQGVYQVNSPHPEYIYEWAVEESNGLSGSSGYTFKEGITTGTSVTINWTLPGVKKVTVTAKQELAACASGSSEPIKVQVKSPFNVSIKGSPIALNDQAIPYTVELKDHEGKTINNIEHNYSFRWTIENGKGTTNPRASNNIQWSASGKVSVKVTEKAPNNNSDYIPLMCAQMATFEVVKTELNSMKGCAETTTAYKLDNPPATPVNITWTVEGGALKDENASIIAQSDESIQVTWSNIASGTIKASIGEGDTEYEQTFTINIDEKPENLALSEDVYKYCDNDEKVSLTSKVTLPTRTLTFYEVKGADIDEEITNPNAYNPKNDTVTVYFVYTTDNGCKYVSKKAEVLKVPPSKVNFTVNVGAGSNITKTGSIGKQPITFCSTNDDENHTLVFKLADATSKEGGKFVITNKNTNQQIGDTIELAADETEAEFAYSLLNAGGNFIMTYTLNELCPQPKNIEIKVLRRVANLDVKLRKTGSNDAHTSFCASDGGSYDLMLEGFPVNTNTVGSFHIKRISGPKYSKGEGFVEITGEQPKLNPSNPMPGEIPPGDDASTEEINQNAGQYKIEYRYKYRKGDTEETYPCEYTSDVLTVTINPLPKLTIEGLKDTYCRNEAKGSIEVFDQGNKDNTSVLVLTQLEYKNDSVPKNGNQWSSVPKNDPTRLTPSETPYEIRARHTNSAGCTNVSAPRKVKVLSEPTGVKLFVSKIYHEQAMYFKSTQAEPKANATEGWEWVINGSVTNTKETMYATKNNSGNISYSMTANIKACKKIVKKDFKLDFSFEGHLVGGTSTLTNKSSLRNENGEDELGNAKWTIADKAGNILGSLDAKNERVTYSFAKAGEYWITLTLVNNAKDVTYELKRRVDIFDVVTITKGENYIEHFENGAKSWVSRGVVTQNQQFVDKTSWQLKPLSNANRDVIKGNQGMVWMTDNGDQTHYYNNEQSYVESPCYNISDLDKPMVSLRYWSHTDKGGDGVALLYTIDDGKTWQKVGKKTPEIENWYNEQGILGAPGSSSDANANKENQGWTGADTTWRTTAYTLSNVRQAMWAQNTSLVRFRIVFGSNSDNPPSQHEGFAFDDFSISNRNRTLLLEYFTNHGVPGAETLDKEVKFFPYNNGNTSTEIISIHHHVGFPKADELNEYNSKDVSGRAFYHGIKNAPMAIIDGLDTSRHPQNEVSSLFYDQRILSVSPFNITIEPSQVANRQMKIKARVTALENFDRPVVIQVVVIEDEVPSQGKTYHHVMRKMLPDAAGTYYKHTWKPGDSYNLDLRPWDVSDLTMKSYRIVVFVEDYDTKEVHQAAVSSTQALRQDEGQAGQEVTGLDKRIVKSGILLFPNPASNEVQLKLAPQQQLKSQAAWEISNLNGQVVGSGVWQPHQRNMRVKVGHLSQGVYLFRVFDVNRVFLLRFEKK